MPIEEIQFVGLIRNKKFFEITGPEFFNAIKACGWREGIGTHFFQQLRKDGPTRQIETPGQLASAIARGTSEEGRNGTTIHRICGDTAYIVYNATSRTLITFSQGSPPKAGGGKGAAWDVDKAVKLLQTQAVPAYGKGKCATFVRQAIEAGGLTVPRDGSGSAKDYGRRLEAIGFVKQPGAGTPYQKGDVAVIAGFSRTAAKDVKKDHLDGHAAMFDGTQWISDFKQDGTLPYPGSDYDKAKPAIVIYRYPKGE